MGMTFDVQRESKGFRVTLGGVIDETADLARVFAGLDGPTTFDLGGVERINSMGLHRWIPLIGELANRHEVQLERIAYVFVLQANSVANLFGKARVRSCLAPYFSPATQETLMIEVGADEVVGGAPPQKACPKTGTPMEFDDLDSYFYFLQRS
jgi:hypothetical protein